MGILLRLLDAAIAAAQVGNYKLAIGYLRVVAKEISMSTIVFAKEVKGNEVATYLNYIHGISESLRKTPKTKQ